ncbi:hypothetical protein MHLNE_12220 [Moorella humiferrea]|uniref:hypothetical protein n=1 Tax=Neomoorella humiferrea TaxID=676965 RepID=UPI0030D26795
MKQRSNNLQACHINFRLRRAEERKTITYCLNLVQRLIPTLATIRLEGYSLAIRGRGYDGRCAVCRCLRKELKMEGIKFTCACPLEIKDKNSNRRVKIGEVFFQQEILEDQKNYLLYRRRAENNPRDLEAHLALGVINEYHGRFAPALANYWIAYELAPEDNFIVERLGEILGFLQQLLSTPKTLTKENNEPHPEFHQQACASTAPMAIYS